VYQTQFSDTVVHRKTIAECIFMVLVEHKFIQYLCTFIC